MLTQFDIDELQQQIQSGNKPELYYVCHMIEPREGVIDEAKFKSVSKFKVIKIKISEINNAYFEYLKYKNNKNKYHEETEEVYYDMFKKYIHHYTVPNEPSGNKDINPRMPSIIYGYNIENKDGSLTNIPSPVKAIFTNELEYGLLKGNDLKNAYNNKKLEWKYMTLNKKEIVDGIEYKYVTSDWYILKCVNFPRTEHILINIKDKTMYFRNLQDAFNTIEQLEA